jgi:hypothetical protein
VVLLLASAALGLVIGLLYHHFALRSQMKFARRVETGGGVMFALGFIARLTAVGATILAVGAWTPLRPVVTLLAFVATFLVLHARDLYQYATRRGPFRDV